MRLAIFVLLLTESASAWSQAMRSAPCMRDLAMHQPREDGAPTATLTIDAMPYARTVTCGSYTLTGSASGAGAVSWSASPSGASGACTGTTSWSCVVSVAPDATGEGVETITVSQAGGGSDTETIGFPVTAGLSSCFDAHNVDGSHNSTLANADPVALWSDEGPAADDLSQGTGTAQPSFRTSIVGGNPVVRCDGGDSMVGAAAADWAYLHDGTGMSAGGVMSVVSTAAIQAYAATSNSAVIGMGLRIDTSGAHRLYVHNGSALIINAASSTGVISSGVFFEATTTYDESDTPDQTQYINGSSVSSSNQTGAPSTSSPATPLTICQRGGGGQAMTGDIVVVRTYTASLTSTQRDINRAVDEWRLGGSFPVTP